MGDELATVLRLVSEGKLSAEEAAPIIEALTRPARPGGEMPRPSAVRGPTVARGATRGRRIRIQVSERGRRVVDVRVPLAFASVAAKMVPGIPESYQALIRQAVETDQVGPIVDAVDEDGDAVMISVE